MKFLPPFSKQISCLIAASVLLLAAAVAFAAPITGVVTNLTTNKPSAGDKVALIQLQQGMQVAANTTTDSRGRYTLNVADSAPMHLVRVTHDGANYFQPAPPGTQTVNINVYNAAEKVAGISTEADVQRIETDQNGLRVIENYFVKNVSSPPRTQFGPRAYPIFLPKDAQIVSAAALGPGSMPVQSSPVPLGSPGAYTFIFPLRPGETRFQVSYRLPYSGTFQFQPRVASSVDNFAIILPKSIHFDATPAAAFQPIDEDVNVQTYLVKNLSPTTKLSFRITGSGQLPQQTAASQAGQNGSSANGAEGTPQNPEAAAQAQAENNTRPGIGLGVPIDTPDPLHKYMWWIISAAVVLLAIGAGISMKRPQPAFAAAGAASTVPPVDGPLLPIGATAASAHNPAPLLATLKDELFALETERLEGRLLPEEYERQKAALEVVLKRALDRHAISGSGVSS
ncbi:MAG: carboxypeptidase regulatory-like domain-containing protein [Acidobacteriaceae bacterium]